MKTMTIEPIQFNNFMDYYKQAREKEIQALQKKRKEEKEKKFSKSA